MFIIPVLVSKASFLFLTSRHTLRLLGGLVKGRSTKDKGVANKRDIAIV